MYSKESKQREFVVYCRQNYLIFFSFLRVRLFARFVRLYNHKIWKWTICERKTDKKEETLKTTMRNMHCAISVNAQCDKNSTIWHFLCFFSRTKRYFRLRFEKIRKTEHTFFDISKRSKTTERDSSIFECVFFTNVWNILRSSVFAKLCL